MNATFFALAFIASLNPKLLAVDLLLAGNRRARAMFACLLFGAVIVAVTIGLLDVLVFHLDAINSQKTVSAGLDLALGLLLLAVGALLAIGRLHSRRKEPVPAGGGPPDRPEKKDGWADRVLANPRLGLVVLVGALIGTPGASYLAGLHILVASNSSTASQVVGVILFVLIEFWLIIVPLAFLQLRPRATEAAVQRAQDWVRRHTWQLIAYITLILGAYLTISALVRLA